MKPNKEGSLYNKHSEWWFDSEMLILLVFLIVASLSFGFVVKKSSGLVRSLYKVSKTSLNVKITKEATPKACTLCKGATVINCSVCKGTGKDKVNGSPLERWTCNKCKGFALVPCTKCNSASKGLTPEQTGERWAVSGERWAVSFRSMKRVEKPWFGSVGVEIDYFWWLDQ